MSRIHWGVLICAPLLIAAQDASARQTRASSPITVTAHETVADWSARMGRSLDDGLDYPRTLGTANTPEGIVKVGFHCSDDGTPTGVGLIASSGSHDLDRAAIRGVQRIATLHPLPVGVGADRAFQAWILFAADEESASRRLADMRRMAARSNQNAQQLAANMTGSSAPVVLFVAR